MILTKATQNAQQSADKCSSQFFHNKIESSLIRLEQSYLEVYQNTETVH